MKYGLLIAGLLSTCVLSTTQVYASASQIQAKDVTSR